MKNNFGTTLFLVESPFQIICMLNAIRQLEITDFDVVILHSDNFSIKMMDKLLKKNNIPCLHKHASHLIKDFWPIAFVQKHRKYENIFIGNYYTLGLRQVAAIWSKFGAKLYFLDDGIQAYRIFSNKPRRLFKNWKIFLAFLPFKLISFIKFSGKYNFYTIYDVYSSKMNIIKNDFALLQQTNSLKASGVYIIGTNSSIVQFMNHSYSEYLQALAVICKNKYPNDKIYYCPHRRDKNNHDVSILCKELGFEIFDTEISVEVDFIERKISPMCVIGFTSNALFTLKRLFETSSVFTVMYRLKNEDSDQEADLIRKHLSACGIQIINIFNE